MKQKGLNRILLFLFHSLGFVLLFFVVRKLDFREIAANLFLFSWWKVLAGLLILLLVYMIKTLRWLVINRSFGIAARYRDLLVFFLFTGFLGTITPGRLGEFAKIWLLRRHYGSGITVSTSSVLLDRIWDVLVLSLMGSISLILVLSKFRIEWYTLAVIGVIFLLALGAIIFPGLIFRPALVLAGKSTLAKELEQIYGTWKKNRLSLILPGFSSSLLAFGMLAFIPVMLSPDLGISLSYGSSISVVSISNILAFLPVSIAGFGTREFIFTRVWEMNALSAETAIAVSTMYFIITYIGSMLLGGTAYMVSLRKLYRFRQIQSGKDGPEQDQ